MNTNNTLRPCGFVVPYVHGGSQNDTAQPVYLVPVGMTGPVPKEFNRALPSKAKPSEGFPKGRKDLPESVEGFTGSPREWFYIGPVKIGADTWDAYGVHYGPSVDVAREYLEPFLGDALARADGKTAVKMVADETRNALDKMIMRLISTNPELAGKTRADLVKMVMAELE